MQCKQRLAKNFFVFSILIAVVTNLGCDSNTRPKDLSRQRTITLQKMLNAADEDYARGKTVLEAVELNPAKSIEEKKKERDGLIQAKHYLDRAKSVYSYVFRQEDLEAAFKKEDMPRRTLEARLASIDDLLLKVQKKIVE